ncbi:MAG: methyltransferase domain-containing protein [Micropruina sp.]|nr:MAG: methyltransferase domain-containing protein [Micropruina sp.]
MALDSAAGLLACPVCAARLDLVPGGAACPAGHRFDAARQGYLNLSGSPEPANADTAAMLAARARVHTAGLFDAVSDAIAGAIDESARVIVEVGAGNAFYLARALDARPDARGLALDVSKAAARNAARAHPRAASIVADVWRGLPVRTGACDAVLAVFAPRNPAEFARVLRPGGRLVVAIPGPGHLAELRERYHLLEVPSDKRERLVTGLAEWFAHRHSARLLRAAPQPAERVADLIAMGPNAFHGTPVEVSAGRVSVDVSVETFVRLS